MHGVINCKWHLSVNAYAVLRAAWLLSCRHYRPRVQPSLLILRQSAEGDITPTQPAACFAPIAYKQWTKRQHALDRAFSLLAADELYAMLEKPTLHQRRCTCLGALPQNGTTIETQQRLTGSDARHHRAITAVSYLLLIVVVCEDRLR